MGIVKELNSLAPDAIVTLFEFNTTPIIDVPTGNDSLYYTNQPVGEDGYILWDGDQYLPFPFEFSGIASSADGTSPARPIISVSNVNKVIFSVFSLLGDLTGVSVKRTQTCFKYTDLGDTPDTNSVFSIQEYTISKMVQHRKSIIEYELSTPLDQPFAKIPKRNILADSTTKNLTAPGIGRIRTRS